MLSITKFGRFTTDSLNAFNVQKKLLLLRDGSLTLGFVVRVTCQGNIMVTLSLSGTVRAHYPGVLQNLLGRVALQGVHHQAPGDQLLGGVGDVVPVGGVELEQSGQDLVEQLLLVVGPAGEGRVAAEEDVQDNAHRPHINLEINTWVSKRTTWGHSFIMASP